eukprot:755882-Hanusia_phi.AAC.2
MSRVRRHLSIVRSSYGAGAERSFNRNKRGGRKVRPDRGASQQVAQHQGRRKEKIKTKTREGGGRPETSPAMETWLGLR